MTEIKSIHGHTELAEVPATADEVLVWDASVAAHRRVSRANYLGYTEYVALLTQSGTGAPTATIIKNDTGATVSLARVISAGIYDLTFSSAVLTADKTLVQITSANNSAGRLNAYQTSTTVVRVNTYNTSFALADALLSSTLIVIRIYK